MSEIAAAFLWAQFEQADDILRRRLGVWERYHALLEAPEAAGLLRRPVIPAGAEHNAHLYYVLVPGDGARDRVIASLAAQGVSAVFHYVPLHTAPAGRRFGRVAGSLPITERVSASLLRLPLWVGMEEAQVEHVAAALVRAVREVGA